MMTHIAKGDVALSISLTGFIGIFSFLTVPFVVNFAYSYFLGHGHHTEFPLGKTIIATFALTFLPVLIGLAIHRNFPHIKEILG